jgi:hypothetical protein
MELDELQEEALYYHLEVRVKAITLSQDTGLTEGHQELEIK